MSGLCGHPALDPPALPRTCWPAYRASCPATGTLATPCGPSCSKPSAKRPALRALATALRTGSISARCRAAASSISATSSTSPSRISSSRPSARTGEPLSIDSCPAIHPGPLERLPLVAIPRFTARVPGSSEVRLVRNLSTNTGSRWVSHVPGTAVSSNWIKRVLLRCCISRPN